MARQRSERGQWPGSAPSAGTGPAALRARALARQRSRPGRDTSAPAFPAQPRTRIPGATPAPALLNRADLFNIPLETSSKPSGTLDIGGVVNVPHVLAGGSIGTFTM